MLVIDSDAQNLEHCFSFDSHNSWNREVLDNLCTEGIKMRTEPKLNARNESLRLVSQKVAFDFVGLELHVQEELQGVLSPHFDLLIREHEVLSNYHL